MSDLKTMFWEIIRDPGLTQLIRRTLDAGVVLDTWMSSQQEEHLAEDAQAHLIALEEQLTQQALAAHAMFPTHAMPPDYVRAAYHALLFSTALYHAQRTKGVPHVDLTSVREAARRVRALVAHPDGLPGLGRFFLTVSSHEDLSALDYYGRMRVDDFLQGTLHQPWSNTVLSARLHLYRGLNLVDQTYTGSGDMLRLTPQGRHAMTLTHIRLGQAGELAWRAEAQRCVIFGETNYDTMLGKVMPDADAMTVHYLDTLGIQPGMWVLEVDCGTGRVTVDLRLSERVSPGGTVTALDPNRVLLNRLAEKCQARHIANVDIVQGRAHALPFLDHRFDAAIAVGTLHFADWERGVAEMTRVTKPGGLVSVLSLAPTFDVREVPMVALWFRPLYDLAAHFEIPVAERSRRPADALLDPFARHLEGVSVADLPGTVDASDPHAFMAVVVRGAAIFQGLLSRLPYQERWDVIARLEATGAELVQYTAPTEQRAAYHSEAAYGRVPIR